MSNSRREFLRTALISSAVLFVPFSPFKVLAGSKSSIFSNEEDLYKLALEAKELFFKRQYAESESIYLRIIELKPAEIEFYDGLKKVYAAQNNDLLIAELYRNGWLANKNNSIFCAKFANELAKLSLGNKKHASEFVTKYGAENILDESISLLNESLTYNPNNSFANDALNRTIKSRNSIYEAKANGHKIYRKKKWKKNPSFHNLSESDITIKIENLKNKSRRTLYFDDEIACREENLTIAEKKLHRALYKKSIQIKDLHSAEQHALKIYELDKNDSQSIGDLRKIYSKQKDFKKLVDFSREVLRNKDDFWSRVALAKSLRKAYEHDGSYQYLNESISIYNYLKDNWAGEFDSIDLTIYDGLANCFRLNNEFTKALEMYNYIDNNIDTEKRYIKNTICIGKAKVYSQQGRYDDAIQLIEQQLSRNINTSYKPNRHRERLKTRKNIQLNEEVEDITLYTFLAKAHHKKGDSATSRHYYYKINQLQPKDKNAEKLSKM